MKAKIKIISFVVIILSIIFPEFKSAECHCDDAIKAVDIYIRPDLAIDYSKDAPTAGLFLMTNGDFTELEQLGVNIHSKIGYIVTTRVPIDMIDTIASFAFSAGLRNRQKSISQS